MKRNDDKIWRIIRSAKRLTHRQGYHQTTLANIAEHSEVSIGNIYYFNTKKQIVNAIIDEQTDRFIERSQQWEKDPDPKKQTLFFP